MPTSMEAIPQPTCAAAGHGRVTQMQKPMDQGVIAAVAAGEGEDGWVSRTAARAATRTRMRACVLLGCDSLNISQLGARSRGRCR